VVEEGLHVPPPPSSGGRSAPGADRSAPVPVLLLDWRLAQPLPVDSTRAAGAASRVWESRVWESRVWQAVSSRGWPRSAEGASGAAVPSNARREPCPKDRVFVAK
jgi:hypothetical protein